MGCPLTIYVTNTNNTLLLFYISVPRLDILKSIYKTKYFFDVLSYPPGLTHHDLLTGLLKSHSNSVLPSVSYISIA